jgi:lipoprotein-anchoring transpeptidase ErfK/SrfK
VEYRIRELYGSRGDQFWVPAAGLKPIYPEDAAPLSPEVENKQIIINIARQTLSCYEDDREVFFCRVSTGRFGEETETPITDFSSVFMKYLSTHMEGGRAGGGYDLAGIGWVTFIVTGGIAVHSTYWHNNFGERTSAGCVNARPDDAKFVFRWSLPAVPYYPGKLEAVAGSAVRVVVS